VPSHNVHTKFDKMLLGRSHPKVHRTLDLLPMKFGLPHKTLHEPLTAMFVGYLVDGNEGAISALIHLALDRASSSRRRK
jgi:hypothetical protein